MLYFGLVVMSNITLLSANNIARTGAATHHTTFGNWTADKALDGRIPPITTNESILANDCSCSLGDFAINFWQVAFEQPVHVGRVVVFSRTDDIDKGAGIMV